MSCQAPSGDTFCLLYMTAYTASVNYVSRRELCKLLTLVVPVDVVVVDDDVVRPVERATMRGPRGWLRRVSSTGERNHDSVGETSKKR